MTSGLEAGDLRLEAGEGEERFLTLTAGSEWRCLGLGRGKERPTRKFGAWGTRAYEKRRQRRVQLQIPSRDSGQALHPPRRIQDDSVVSGILIGIRARATRAWSGSSPFRGGIRALTRTLLAAWRCWRRRRLRLWRWIHLGIGHLGDCGRRGPGRGLDLRRLWLLGGR